MNVVGLLFMLIMQPVAARKGVMRIILPILAICFMCTSCTPDNRSGKGISAGPFFQIRPRAPKAGEYRGYQTEYAGYDRPAALAPILHPEEQRQFGGRGAAGGPVQPLPAQAVYHRGDVIPIEQEVYGGQFRDKGDDGKYRLSTGDKIRIIVDEHPEFSGTLEVKADGSIELPLTQKRLNVSNMTTDDVTRSVSKLLAPYFRGTPIITTAVELAASRYYYVFGEVTNQGRFPMGLNNIRVSEVVMRANSTIMAGTDDQFSVAERLQAEVGTNMRENFGNPKYADLRKVYLITPHRSNPEREVVNVKDALLQGRTGDDPYIKPGQIIFVPSSIDGRTIRFLERITDVLNGAENTDTKTNYWYKRLGGK